MKYLAQNKAWDIVGDYNIDKLLYLLIDRPDEINIINDFIWKNNKALFHRDYDLPAYILRRESKIILWLKNDNQYRKNNKPSEIRFNGYKNIG